MKEPAVQLLQSPSLWALRQAAEGRKERRKAGVMLCLPCARDAPAGLRTASLARGHKAWQEV